MWSRCYWSPAPAAASAPRRPCWRRATRLCGRGELREQLGGRRRGGARHPRGRRHGDRGAGRRRARRSRCCAMFAAGGCRARPRSPPWSTTPAWSTCAARVDEMSVARLERMFDINVIGSIVCAREAMQAHEHAARRQRRRDRQRVQRGVAPRARRGSTSTTRRPRARSTPSPSAWPRKSPPKASASTRCGRD